MVIDNLGRIVYENSSGSANVASTDLGILCYHLSEALAGHPPVQAVVGCFAGLVSMDQESAIRNILLEITNCPKIQIYPDYAASLFAAPTDTDVVVISGTGSIVCSRQGEAIVKSGGGGLLLGDFGSAFDIGRTLIHAVCVDLLPMCESIVQALELEFGTAKPDRVVANVYSHSSPAPAIARLAPAVGVGFLNSDLACVRSVNRLVLLAETTNRHVDYHFHNQNQFKIALAGGLWDANSIYSEQFELFLHNSPAYDDPYNKNFRQYHVERLSQSPVSGAAHLAKNNFYGN